MGKFKRSKQEKRTVWSRLKTNSGKLFDLFNSLKSKDPDIMTGKDFLTFLNRQSRL